MAPFLALVHEMDEVQREIMLLETDRNNLASQEASEQNAPATKPFKNAILWKAYCSMSGRIRRHKNFLKLKRSEVNSMEASLDLVEAVKKFIECAPREEIDKALYKKVPSPLADEVKLDEQITGAIEQSDDPEGGDDSFEIAETPDASQATTGEE